MVYDGLKAAPKGDKCVGVYRPEAGLWSHGPDAPPKGVDIKAGVAPVVKTKAVASDPARPEAGEVAAAEVSGRPQDAPAADAVSAKAPASEAPDPAGGSGKATAAGPAGQTVQCDGDAAPATASRSSTAVQKVA